MLHARSDRYIHFGIISYIGYFFVYIQFLNNEYDVVPTLIEVNITPTFQGFILSHSHTDVV